MNPYPIFIEKHKFYIISGHHHSSHGAKYGSADSSAANHGANYDSSNYGNQQYGAQNAADYGSYSASKYGSSTLDVSLTYWKSIPFICIVCEIQQSPEIFLWYWSKVYIL